MKKKVAVVDSAEMLGGVCVHTGTIPSKTFREAVIFLGGYRQRGFYGKSYSTRSNITISDILNRVRCSTTVFV
jgi:NAD(P) transhydrogenase